MDPFRFLDLYPELRNMVYDYIFSMGPAEGQSNIDLFTDTAPSPALLRANKQVYQESKQIYLASIRDYYAQNEFILHIPDLDKMDEYINVANQQFDLQRITKLTLHRAFAGEKGYMEYELQPGRKIWSCETLHITRTGKVLKNFWIACVVYTEQGMLARIRQNADDIGPIEASLYETLALHPGWTVVTTTVTQIQTLCSLISCRPRERQPTPTVDHT